MIPQQKSTHLNSPICQLRPIKCFMDIGTHRKEDSSTLTLKAIWWVPHIIVQLQKTRFCMRIGSMNYFYVQPKKRLIILPVSQDIIVKAVM